uniref:Uncharacterized protein n=1 Tax=uncultured marine thaumarchaeote KM3_73_F02 TaxID=1456268 RepID=A0A075HKA1_9ARCH|nr:hypothetical protein [uncultured marine thaumarchaeote KM3_73_F02]
MSLWVSKGLSLTISQDVFLAVTNNHMLFLLGFAAVLASILVETYWSLPYSKSEKVDENIEHMEKLAVLSLVLAAIFGLELYLIFIKSLRSRRHLTYRYILIIVSCSTVDHR